MGAEYIHAHFGAAAATAAWAAARGLGVPFGFTAHAQEIFRKANPWLREKTLAAALPLTISQFHRRFLIDRLGPAVGGRFAVVRCGVDLSQFTSREVAPTHDISSVGRLVEKKGFDLLLRALACLPRPRPSCRIVGDGPLRADLEQEIRRQGLADRCSCSARSLTAASARWSSDRGCSCCPAGLPPMATRTVCRSC